MITRKDIIEELNKRGYRAEKQDNMRNGTLYHGICIFEKNSGNTLVPIVYTDDLIEKAVEQGWSIEELTDKIMSIWMKYKKSKQINITEKDLQDRDYILKHLYIGVQKESIEKIEKKETPFDGIEKYLYIRSNFNEDGSSYITKVSIIFLIRIGIKKEEAWLNAEKNTFKETVIRSMTSVIKDAVPLYIVSNECMMRGASGILNKGKMKGLSLKLGTNIFVIFPSSIHEMVVMPYYGPYQEALDNLDDYSRMVEETNYNEVDPWERLADRAFIMEI